MVRRLRQHADEIGPVIRLYAPYGSMVRASLSMHTRLMRVRALRQKWDSIDGPTNADAPTLRVAERSIPGLIDPDAEPLQAKRPEAMPVTTRVGALAACIEQQMADSVSASGTDSHAAAFETELSEQRWNRVSRGSGETGLREAIGGLRSPGLQ